MPTCIASKGKDEVGNDTGAETNIDMQLMFDAGAAMGVQTPDEIAVRYRHGDQCYQYRPTSFLARRRGARARPACPP